MSNSQLTRHKNLKHSKNTKYDCKFCGKRLGGWHDATKHELSHREPQFQCSICAKEFKADRALIAHEKFHRGEKPFDCSTCGGGFTSLHGLRQHEKGVHKISGPRGGKTGWSGKGAKGTEKERKDIKDIS